RSPTLRSEGILALTAVRVDPNYVADVIQATGPVRPQPLSANSAHRRMTWPDDRLVPQSLTVAAPTCRGYGAIRPVGTPPARRRGRRLRRSVLPAHPVRRGRPTRRPPLRSRHPRRLLTGLRTASRPRNRQWYRPCRAGV